MSIDLATLTDEQSVGLARIMARRWIEQSGVEAFVAFQQVQSQLLTKGLILPDWIDLLPSEASPELVSTSRTILRAIADGENESARIWLESELDDLRQARAHMGDPVTLSIVGATLVACILAARVKKIGSTEFYKGLTPELAKIIKAAGLGLSKE